jgi:hypothetical protein
MRNSTKSLLYLPPAVLICKLISYARTQGMGNHKQKDDAKLDNVPIVDHVMSTIVPLRGSEQMPTHSSAQACGEFRI